MPIAKNIHVTTTSYLGLPILIMFHPVIIQRRNIIRVEIINNVSTTLVDLLFYL